MSKSTQRYGEVTFDARVSIEANPKPTRKLLRNWSKLETAARQMFRKSYDNLTSKQKTTLHEDIAEKRNQARKECEAKTLKAGVA